MNLEEELNMSLDELSVLEKRGWSAEERALFHRLIRQAYEEDPATYLSEWVPHIMDYLPYASRDLMGGFHQYLVEEGPITVDVNNIERHALLKMQLTLGQGTELTRDVDERAHGFLSQVIRAAIEEEPMQRGTFVWPQDAEGCRPMGEPTVFEGVEAHGIIWFDERGRTVLEWVCSSWTEETYAEIVEGSPATYRRRLDERLAFWREQFGNVETLEEYDYDDVRSLNIQSVDATRRPALGSSAKRWDEGAERTVHDLANL